jgi:hypothetical protein
VQVVESGEAGVRKFIDFGCRVGVAFCVSCFVFRDSGFGIRDLGEKIKAARLPDKVQGPEFKVWVSGSRLLASGFDFRVFPGEKDGVTCFSRSASPDEAVRFASNVVPRPSASSCKVSVRDLSFKVQD